MIFVSRNRLTLMKVTFYVYNSKEALMLMLSPGNGDGDDKDKDGDGNGK